MLKLGDLRHLEKRGDNVVWVCHGCVKTKNCQVPWSKCTELQKTQWTVTLYDWIRALNSLRPPKTWWFKGFTLWSIEKTWEWFPFLSSTVIQAHLECTHTTGNRENSSVCITNMVHTELYDNTFLLSPSHRGVYQAISFLPSHHHNVCTYRQFLSPPNFSARLNLHTSTAVQDSACTHNFCCCPRGLCWVYMHCAQQESHQYGCTYNLCEITV